MGGSAPIGRVLNETIALARIANRSIVDPIGPADGVDADNGIAVCREAELEAERLRKPLQDRVRA